MIIFKYGAFNNQRHKLSIKLLRGRNRLILGKKSTIQRVNYLFTKCIKTNKIRSKSVQQLALDTTYLILLSIICLLVSLFYQIPRKNRSLFYFIFPYVRLNDILVITTKFSILHFCMYYLPFVVYLSDWHVNHHYNIINTTLYIYICACITSLLWYLQYYQHIRYLHLYMDYLPFFVSTILSTH